MCTYCVCTTIIWKGACVRIVCILCVRIMCVLHQHDEYVLCIYYTNMNERVYLCILCVRITCVLHQCDVKVLCVYYTNMNVHVYMSCVIMCTYCVNTTPIWIMCILHQCERSHVYVARVYYVYALYSHYTNMTCTYVLCVYYTNMNVQVYVRIMCILCAYILIASCTNMHLSANTHQVMPAVFRAIWQNSFFCIIW